MPVKQSDVIAKVQSRESEYDPDQLRRIVVETISACRLDVSPRTGEIRDRFEGGPPPVERVRLDDVIAMLLGKELGLDRAQCTRIARNTISACGLDVSGGGEIYNPAEGAYRPQPLREVDRDQRFATKRR